MLAATVWWPLSARLAMRLIGYGCRVAAICPPGHFLRYVTGMGPIYRYSSLRSLASLESAIRRVQPDLVIPCDDRVVWQLHELHETKPDLRPLIEASLGAAGEFGIVRQRERLLETARKLGIRVPETRPITSEADIRAWFAHTSSAVLKLDGTWGGEGVEIAHSEEKALAAWRRLAQPPQLTTALKRLLVNHDALALWGWQRRIPPVVTIQQFIKGRPANSMLACWQGELLRTAGVEVLGSQGPTGAAFAVRLIENAEMARAGRLLAEGLKLSGFYGLDFMLDEATGRAYMIEMNPRCTQLGHLPMPGGDLAGALCSKLTGEACMQSEPAIVEGGIVAFFPQAISWNPDSPWIRDGYHDIPKDQPELVRQLRQKIWPERQWISRLYHRFRPQRKTAAVEFDAEKGSGIRDQGSETSLR